MSAELAILILAGATAVAALVLVGINRALAERVDENARRASQANKDNAVLERFVTPKKLVQLRFVWACAAAVALMAVLIVNDVFDPGVLAAGALFAVVGGWQAPLLYYKAKVRKRKAHFDSQILGLTMSLANGILAGQALPNALAMAKQNSPQPMQEELGIVLGETQLGLSLSESLDKLYARMPSEDLQLLITSIRLSSSTGGKLSEVLSRMVETIRSRTEFQEKVKTKTAQGRFEAIAMALAPLFVYVILRLIDPELMKPMTTTAVGWTAIVAVVLMVSIGFFIINKIVTIEV